jgi:hypothetical protein
MDFDEFVNKLKKIEIKSIAKESALRAWESGEVKELLTSSYESSKLLDGFDFGTFNNQIHWFASSYNYPVGGGTYVTLNITGNFREGLTVDHDLNIISKVDYFSDIRKNFEKRNRDVVTVESPEYVKLFDRYFNEQFRKSWGI